ncbi:PLP-dependent aminotransferase family protein [Vibrio tapetis subsp. quintayensis]|uniref:aminotransferase-like domain-containing protein n=1 Tax=Vibrio tapetis TaxID=52443 RepID=UPI0025B3CF1E|nr:PLP-dependent aminotransferase family protein [Vibrio tapetis]MDN3683092.1 PLP-dependent aminotransferase family protein [Vibrio tapetis subsp. quintayensis]
MFKPEIEGRTGHKYIALADAFAEAIESGELEAGSKLPPQRILSYKIGVTVGTVTRAYQELLRRDLVEPKVGSGTYVKDRESEHHGYYYPVAPREGIDMAICRPLLVNQQSHFHDSLLQLAQEPIAQNAVLGYHSAAGLHGHSQVLRSWLSEKWLHDIDSRRLCWTYGGQHGLSAILQGMTRPSDVVLVEGLCYAEFVHACQQSERKVVPIKLDEYGVVPEDLHLQCQRHSPKLLYLTAAVQNPTCVQLSDSRRLQVIEICRRFGVMIIEDDVLYCPPENRKSPLVAIAPDITIYVGSFSKYFSGGIRVGFLIFPLALQLALQKSLRASCMNVSPLLVDLVCRWLSNGAMNAVDEEIAQELKARYRIFETFFPNQTQHAIAGFNVWLELPSPINSASFRKKLTEEGVHVREAELFAVGHHRIPPCVRLSLTGPTSRSQLKEGLRIIYDAIHSDTAACLTK